MDLSVRITAFCNNDTWFGKPKTKITRIVFDRFDRSQLSVLKLFPGLLEPFIRRRFNAHTDGERVYSWLEIHRFEIQLSTEEVNDLYRLCQAISLGLFDFNRLSSRIAIM